MSSVWGGETSREKLPDIVIGGEALRKDGRRPTDMDHGEGWNPDLGAVEATIAFPEQQDDFATEHKKARWMRRHV